MDGQMNRSTRPNYCFVYRHQKKIALVLVPLVAFLTVNFLLALAVFVWLFLTIKSDKYSHFRNTSIRPVSFPRNRNTMGDIDTIWLTSCSLFHFIFVGVNWADLVSITCLKIMLVLSTAAYWVFVFQFNSKESRWIRLSVQKRFKYFKRWGMYPVKLSSVFSYNIQLFIICLVYVIAYLGLVLPDPFPNGVTGAMSIFTTWAFSSTVINYWHLRRVAASV